MPTAFEPPQIDSAAVVAECNDVDVTAENFMAEVIEASTHSLCCSIYGPPGAALASN